MKDMYMCGTGGAVGKVLEKWETFYKQLCHERIRFVILKEILRSV